MALEAGTTDTPGLVGLGFLGYTALHKEREPVGPGQAGAGVRGAATARPPLTTSTPEATSTKPGFSEASALQSWLLALSRKSRRTIAGAGGAAGLLPPVCRLSVCALSDGTAGLSPDSQPYGAPSGRVATLLPGDVVTLLQDHVRQLVTDRKGAALL